MLNLSYRPKQRIKRRAQFLELQANGKKAYSRHFLILYEATELAQSRLGVTVTKKVDSRAVKRNLVKRKIKEFFRHSQHRFNSSFDILVIARNNAPALASSEIWRELEGAFVKTGMLSKE